MVEDQAPRCRAFERSTGEDQPKPHAYIARLLMDFRRGLFTLKVINDGFSDHQPDLITLIVFDDCFAVGVKAL